MANRGRAVMGTGVARGEGRAMEATHKAISSSLLEDGSIKGARGVLINVTGGQDLGMLEHNEAISVIKNEVDPHAEIKCGIVINPVMSEEIMVTVLATGFDEEGVRSLSKRPSNLKEFRKTEEKPLLKRRLELSNTGDLFGGKKEDLDKPAYLRRAAD
jgi:cell division protein FtsZ